MTGFKIFFAAAFGALIGALTGLQIAEHSLWAAIAGFFVGGFTGYVSYEFKTVLQTIRDVWRSMPHILSNGWLIFRSALKSWLMVTLYMTAPTASLILCVFSVPLIATMTEDVMIGFKLVAVCVGIALFICLVMGPALVKGCGSNLDGWKKIALYTNPLAVFGYWPFVGLYRGSRWLVVNRRPIWNDLVSMTAGIFIFTKRIYIGIHSDVRLMLFIDSGLGTLVGYVAGNALIGALAGGILGILNYYLVATFLLGITPKGVNHS